MSAKMKTGQIAEIAGPKKANIFPNPNVAAAMISKAKRPLLVIGSDAKKIETDEGDLIDSAILIMNNNNCTVVATGHLVGEFRKRGFEDAFSMSIFVLGQRISDPNWNGFDGKGPYDTVVFAGFPYYVEWLVESGLKNFAQKVRTISLDRTYQPNAEWSLGWMPKPDWREAISIIVRKMEEE